MANLNTTQIAHGLLGPSHRVYHQDLTTHANQPRLKIDKLGAGDLHVCRYDSSGSKSGTFL